MGSNEVRISWQAIASGSPDSGHPSLQGYEVQHQSEAGGDWSTVRRAADPDGLSTTFSHTQFRGGQQNSYRVRAVNTFQVRHPDDTDYYVTNPRSVERNYEGGWSAEVRFTPDLQFPSAPPHNFVARLDANTGAYILTWVAPENGTRADLRTYTLVHQESDGQNVTVQLPVSRGAEHTLANPTRGYRYRWRIFGTGPLGDTNGVELIFGTHPAPELTTVGGDRHVQLTWYPGADSFRGGSAISWRVRHRRVGAMAWVSEQPFGTSETRARTIGVATAGTYEVELAAINAGGVGLPAVARATVSSAARTLSPTAAGVGVARYEANGRVTNLRGPTVAVLGDTIEFTISGDDGLVRIGIGSDEQIVGTIDSAGNQSDCVYSASGTPACLIEPMHSDTIIQTHRGGAPGAARYWLTGGADRPADGHGVSAGHRMRVKVSPLLRQAGRYFDVGINPVLDGAGQFTWAGAAVISPQGQDAFFRVRLTTLAVAPTSPLALRVQRIAAEYELRWEPPINAAAAGVDEYKVWRQTNGGKAVLQATTEQRRSVFAALPGHVYTWYVVAHAGELRGAESERVTVGLPPAPVDLYAEPGDRQAVLYWQLPTATNNRLATESWSIWTATSSAGPWEPLAAELDVATTQYEVLGMRNFVTRYFVISGHHDDFAGAYSNFIPVTPNLTHAYLASPPNDLQLVPGERDITLSWELPDDDGRATITGYRIEISMDARVPWSELVSNTGTVHRTYQHRQDVRPGVETSFRVAAINSVGPGAVSTVAATTVARSAPDGVFNLQATDGTNEIRLQWAPPVWQGGDPITAYIVERKGDEFGAQWLAVQARADGVVETTYVDVGLRPHQFYEYRVAAANRTGISPWSETVAGATGPDSAPVAPDQVTATHARGAVTLTWRAPLFVGSAAISEYRAEKSIDDRASWMPVTDTWQVPAETTEATAEPTITDIELAAGTIHYRVRAVNAVGASLPSEPVAITVVAVPPDPPTHPHALRVGLDNVVHWVTPRFTGYLPLLGYRIQRAAVPQGGTWEVVAAGHPPTELSYRDPAVSPISTWHYQIFAVNAHGVSVPSATVPVRASTGAPSAPPQLLAVVDQTTVTVTWGVPDETGGSPITRYIVERTTNPVTSAWRRVATNVPATDTPRYVDIGYVHGVDWYYRVTATNQVAIGAASYTVRAGPAPTVPGPPINIAGVAVGNDVLLTWDVPRVTGRRPILHYTIERTDDPAGVWTTLVEDHPGTQPRFTDVAPPQGTHWYYRVAATNMVGTGSATVSTLSVTVAAGEVPTPPRGVRTVGGAGYIDVHWASPSDRKNLTHYSVWASADGQTSWRRRGPSLHALTYRDQGLAVGEVKYYRVGAHNSRGRDGFSAVAPGQAATTAGAPINLRATAEATRIILDWDAPADLYRNTVLGYQIQSGRAADRWTTVVADTRNAVRRYVDIGVLAGERYFYRIAMHNEFGLGTWSDVLEVTAAELMATANLNYQPGVTADDAAIMYYAYAWPELVGDGTLATGFTGLRRALLGHRTGSPSWPADLQLAQLVTAASVWAEQGMDVGGDLNRDGQIDTADALILYYAIQLSHMLGDGRAGQGSASFRQTFLRPLGSRQGLVTTDDELLEMLRNANALLR